MLASFKMLSALILLPILLHTLQFLELLRREDLSYLHYPVYPAVDELRLESFDL